MTTIPLPAGAVLHPLDIPAAAEDGSYPEPAPVFREFAEMRNAVLREVSGRDDDDATAEELQPGLADTPNCIIRRWYVRIDGRMVGYCGLDRMLDEDGSTGMFSIFLLREVWGRGIGTAVYAHLESTAREAGVRNLVHWSEHHDDGTGLEMLPSPTGSGAVPADRAARFLTRHGLRLEQVERASELVWAPDADARLRALRDEAAEHAGDYRIVQWAHPTPDDYVPGYAWMKSRMSTDAPDADLGLPEETWDTARVRVMEERLSAQAWTCQVTAAQHIATGELCAFNELTIGSDPSTTTFQEDTLVLSEHRGHRLGMLVKTVGLLSWHEAHPDSPKVVTYNAEENRPMLSINEAIGFTAFVYEGAWKKVLAD